MQVKQWKEVATQLLQLAHLLLSKATMIEHDPDQVNWPRNLLALLGLGLLTIGLGFIYWPLALIAPGLLLLLAAVLGHLR